MRADISVGCPSAIRAVPWSRDAPPRRILAIRLQAFGDVVITLPYLRGFAQALPGCAIDFLTCAENADIPRSLHLFREVLAVESGRDSKGQMVAALGLIPRLIRRRYDVVLDLQNDRASKVVRGAIRPEAWSAFDRFSPVSAGERVRRTIEAAGIALPCVEAALPMRDPGQADEILCAAGWRPDMDLVVLSPAGAFPTRNWPIENYACFADRWGARHPALFAVLGMPKLRARADELQAALGGRLLNLVGRTTAAQALAIVQKARLVLTEDCGLMHMAWVSGVPTLALFGSSPHVWSGPIGRHTRCLHSGDLACGSCMNAQCRFGDVRCLTRYTPERVVREAEDLLDGIDGKPLLVGSVHRREVVAIGSTL